MLVVLCRVLNRDKASPAHLRGRRPPSLVSSETEPEIASALTTTDTAHTMNTRSTPSPCLLPPSAFTVNHDNFEETPGRDLHSPSPCLSLLEETEALVARLRPPKSEPAKSSGLIRRPSLRGKKDEERQTLTRTPSVRKSDKEDTSTFVRRPSLRKKTEDEANPSVARKLSFKKDDEKSPASLVRRPSLRRNKEEAEKIAKIQASPSSRRKEFGLPDGTGGAKPRREVPSPSATPSLRRKGSIRHTLESLRKAASDEGEKTPILTRQNSKTQLGGELAGTPLERGPAVPRRPGPQDTGQMVGRT